MKIYQEKNSARGYYLEIQNVQRVEGEYIYGASRPVSRSTIRRLVGTIADQKIDAFTQGAFLPEGLLQFRPMFHERFILWHKPQSKQTLQIKKQSITLWMPAMLYAVVFDKFYLFALKSNSRPSMNTELFVAPVMNLSGSINMCWGSVSTKHTITAIDQEMKFWEDRLWNSTFAHVGSTCSKHEIMSVYTKIAKTGAKFPKSELVNINMTLRSFLKEHLT